MMPTTGCTQKAPAATAIYAAVSGTMRSFNTSLLGALRHRTAFVIPGRVGFLHAIGVLGHRHRCPNPAPSHVVAVHNLALGIGEHGFLTHAAGEGDENKSNRYSCHTASLRGGRMVAQ